MCTVRVWFVLQHGWICFGWSTFIIPANGLAEHLLFVSTIITSEFEVVFYAAPEKGRPLKSFWDG